MDAHGLFFLSRHKSATESSCSKVLVSSVCERSPYPRTEYASIVVADLTYSCNQPLTMNARPGADFPITVECLRFVKCLYMVQAYHAYAFSPDDLAELEMHHKLKLLCLTCRQTAAPKKELELEAKAAKYPLGCAILHGQLQTFQFLFLQVQELRDYLDKFTRPSFTQELRTDFFTMIRESLDALALRMMRQPKGSKAMQHAAGLAAVQGQCCFGTEAHAECREIAAWGSFVVQNETKSKTSPQKHHILQLACGMWDGLYLSEQVVYWLICQKVDYPEPKDPKAGVSSDLKISISCCFVWGAPRSRSYHARLCFSQSKVSRALKRRHAEKEGHSYWHESTNLSILSHSLVVIVI